MNRNPLVRLRRKAGLTQAELAKRTNTPQPNIARLESGERSISAITLETAARLAKALGVHAEELLEKKEDIMKVITITNGSQLDAYDTVYYLSALESDSITPTMEVLQDYLVGSGGIYKVIYKSDAGMHIGTAEAMHRNEKAYILDKLEEMGIVRYADNGYIEGYCAGENY